MIVKAKNVIGLKIITIDTGTVIETVDDIAYNPNTQRVEALLVQSGGLFHSAKAILMDNVHNIGEDAVVVPSADVIQSVKQLADVVHSIADSNKHLVKTNVLTVEGKELGRITDLYFDSASGKVDSMEVSQGGLKTLTEGKKSIKPADIVTIGADATIVSNYIELQLEAQGEKGGLKGTYNEAKEKAAELTESAKQSAQEAAEQVRHTSAEVAETVREKSAEFKKTAEEKAAEAKVVLDQKSAEARVKAEELREDLAEKTRELDVALDKKTTELRAVSAQKSDEARVKAEELAAEAKLKARELQDAAEVKAKETRKNVHELSDEISAIRDQRSKVVERTAQTIEDGAKKVEVRQTKVTKRK